IKPLGANSDWQITVDGAGAQGQATWRSIGAGRSMLRAHFSHLHINTLQTPAGNGNTAANDSKAARNPTLANIDPARLPAVEIGIDSLRVGSTGFGTARINANAIKEGWRLTQAELAGGALSVDAAGQWTRHVGLTRARLNF